MPWISWILRTVTAAAALAGIASAAAAVFGWTLGTLTPRQMGLSAGVFVATAMLLGGFEFLQAREKDRIETARSPAQQLPNTSSTTGPVITGSTTGPVITGSTTGPVTHQVIGSLTINSGDSPAVQREKQQRAVDLLAEVVLGDVIKLHRRMQLIRAAVEPDEFEAELRAVRERVAPALQKTHSSGYRQLIAQERVSSLRHELNSERVAQHLPTVVLDLAHQAGADPTATQTFLDAVAEADRVIDSLLGELQKIAGRAQADDAQRQHDLELLTFYVELAQNRNAMAEAAGLRALHGTDVAPSPQTLQRPQQPEHKPPLHPLDAEGYKRRMQPLVAQAEQLLERRTALVAKSTAQRDDALGELASLNAQLQIAPTDSWAQVVGKARALRQLGRIGDAAAAFARYGELFAPTDPGAPAYARTAQQFTLELKQLNLEGGVYLFEVVPGGAANRAELQVGDIVISYGGTPTPGTKEISQALHDAPPGDVIKLEYLRMSEGGRFVRGSAQVAAGPLQAGMMPI